MQDHAPDEPLPTSMLRWRRNVRPDLDYVASLSEPSALRGFAIVLRYVPDKLLIEPTSLTEYLAKYRASAGADAATHPETVALALLDDINNDIVPRWVQITVRSVADGPAPAECVVLEDRQPNWANAAILATLPDL